jgi:Asp-tRNA(Asn)/Glu-tRNA(Gln) amidotransferase B subunit
MEQIGCDVCGTTGSQFENPTRRRLHSLRDACQAAFEIRLETGRIVELRGLDQTSDTGAIEAVIADVLAASQDKVAEYHNAKDKLFSFVVCQPMKAMSKMNRQLLNELLGKAR